MRHIASYVTNRRFLAPKLRELRSFKVYGILSGSMKRSDGARQIIIVQLPELDASLKSSTGFLISADAVDDFALIFVVSTSRFPFLYNFVNYRVGLKLQITPMN